MLRESPNRRDALARISAGIAAPVLLGLGGCGGDDDDDDGGSSSGRSRAEVVTLKNNLHQIGIAAHNYAEQLGGEFPADYFVDGKPALSWRVRLLPYFDEMRLFKQFRTNEPWDSEHNSKLAEQMPRVFHDPKCYLPGHTPLLFPAGKGTINDLQRTRMRNGRGIRLSEVIDGLTFTILAVKAKPERAVPWTQPADLPFNPAKPFDGLELIDDKYMVLFGDGHVSRIDPSLPLETQKALFTPNGREMIPADAI